MTELQIKWLLLEGALPLFGAGLLFTCWGIVLAIAKGNTATRYAWGEAIDSMGWIYGALTIAIQSGIRSFSASPQATTLGYGCIIGATVCALLLLAAMGERGADATWRPPLSLKMSAILLVLAILYAGSSVQGLQAQTSQNAVAAKGK